MNKDTKIQEQKGNGVLPCVSTRTYSQDEVNELLEKIANKFQNRTLYGTSAACMTRC